jgi:prepilin-type N-terminal cleavage/methylation domain-containing protein
MNDKNEMKKENIIMKHKENKGFTLVELMIVILIIGALSALIIPRMQKSFAKAKWSEGNAAAGTIRTAIRVYAAETSVATAQGLVGKNLADETAQAALGLDPNDLAGTYFVPGDYTISAVNDSGVASITVTGGSKADSPTGTYSLDENGKWVIITGERPR